MIRTQPEDKNIQPGPTKRAFFGTWSNCGDAFRLFLYVNRVRSSHLSDDRILLTFVKLRATEKSSTTLAKKIETNARTWHRCVICRACTRLYLACVPVSIFLARVVPSVLLCDTADKYVRQLNWTNTLQHSGHHVCCHLMFSPAQLLFGNSLFFLSVSITSLFRVSFTPRPPRPEINWFDVQRSEKLCLYFVHKIPFDRFAGVN